MKRLILMGMILGTVSLYSQHPNTNMSGLADEIERTLVDNELKSWYPRTIDEQFGGFLTNFDALWQPGETQDKMIVTQARHVWTTAKAAQLYPDVPIYRTAANAGFRFLAEYMWDHEFGGFYQMRTRQGGPLTDGYRDEKRVYGNAFGLYAAAAYYELTRDPQALDFAQQIFHWIEATAYDRQNGGYFQFISREGRTFGKGYPSTAGDSLQFGYKDQNPTIHLLEAYSELYRVWPDSLLRQRLTELLLLVRDKITQPRGTMRLFFTADWRPISLQDSSETFIRKNYGLDHVSFGHDIETGYLLLEASAALGWHDDERTAAVAKLLVDHALTYGWDNRVGGIYHAGYYFKGEREPRIIRDDKDWWSQAEALNSLLMMSQLYPDEEKYHQAFLRQWEYIKTYVIDWEHGGWYSLGLDTRPQSRDDMKAHSWKGSYHTSRALMNVVKMLREGRLFETH
ncbi:MAG: N-acylglucosamine 2-epimerase [Calditrichaeota bacterium]|nr:MAG: N-acylglucosamine 2-epimerase [Calditrichota bacterium]